MVAKKVVKKTVGPQVGSIVHVTTVTYAYRGKLEAVSEGFFELSDAVLVFETGELKQYRAGFKGTMEEAVAPQIFIACGAVVAVETLR
jgi:hypothetical protein